jgi:hypothetical protein
VRVLIALIALGMTACDTDSVVCGPGTMAINGECRLETAISPDQCGSGTFYDSNTSSCLPVPFEHCVEGWTVIDENGTSWCECTGHPDCHDTPITCPQPSPGRMTTCGAVFDLETNLRIIGDEGGVPRCGAGDTEPPCDVRVRPYDALEYANDPDDEPIAAENTTTDEDTFLDRCGRFRLEDMVPPQLDLLALVVDDHGTADSYPPTMLVRPAAADLRVPNIKAIRTRAETISAWETALGTTLLDQGILIAVFLHGDTRVPGVTVDDAYYFADTDPDLISQPATDLTATGVNGAALVTDLGALQPFQPTGGAPPGCAWPQHFVGTLPGVLTYQEFHAVEAANPDLSCP